MATQNEPQVKKRSDAYTGILAISFLALVGATVFLYLEYQNYENKTLPKTPVIDVPGARLQSDPKSGGPPAPKAAPKAPDNQQPDMNMPMADPGMPMPMPMPMMMRNERRPENSRPPALLPIEPVQVVRPAANEDPVIVPPPQPIEQVKLVVPEKVSDPIIQIPDLPLPPPPAPIGNVVVPVRERRVKSEEPKPIIPVVEPVVVPVVEPSLSDVPPPVKPFTPPPR